MRQKLLENGVLVQEGEYCRFTQDYTFTSPSKAMAVLMARNGNGRIEWKDADGRTLKEIQEAQAGE